MFFGKESKLKLACLANVSISCIFCGLFSVQKSHKFLRFLYNFQPTVLSSAKKMLMLSIIEHELEKKIY